jgi:hypothetical protein
MKLAQSTTKKKAHDAMNAFEQDASFVAGSTRSSLRSQASNKSLRR